VDWATAAVAPIASAVAADTLVSVIVTPVLLPFRPSALVS
jgi:hypothetical protein